MGSMCGLSHFFNERNIKTILAIIEYTCTSRWYETFSKWVEINLYCSLSIVTNAFLLYRPTPSRPLQPVVRLVSETEWSLMCTKLTMMMTRPLCHLDWRRANCSWERCDRWDWYTILEYWQNRTLWYRDKWGWHRIVRSRSPPDQIMFSKCSRRLCFSKDSFEIVVCSSDRMETDIDLILNLIIFCPIFRLRPSGFRTQNALLACCAHHDSPSCWGDIIAGNCNGRKGSTPRPVEE